MDRNSTVLLIFPNIDINTYNNCQKKSPVDELNRTALADVSWVINKDHARRRFVDLDRPKRTALFRKMGKCIDVETWEKKRMAPSNFCL